MKKEQESANPKFENYFSDSEKLLIENILDNNMTDQECPWDFNFFEEKEENFQRMDESSNNAINIDQLPDEMEVKNKDQILQSVNSKKKGLKEYKCNVEGCVKKYKSKENLSLHLKNIHENVKPYKCKFCFSAFSHRNGKSYHERKCHLQYLPYKCTYENCKKCFASKSAMIAHKNSFHLKLKKGKKK